MPTASASRTIAASVEDLWKLVSDPYHLPRWWPRVTRVEDVGEGTFTEVMMTKKGNTVRADYSVVVCDATAHELRWAQQIDGTPFARVLKSAETELRLTSAVHRTSTEDAGQRYERESAATDVTIVIRRAMAEYSPRFGFFTGFSPRLGGYMVKRASLATIKEALIGLERIVV